jgi:tetratricopeptide (TPR) repeat protein
MGKYFVPSMMRTPADRLREALDKAEQAQASLRGAGPRALELLHLIDRIVNLLAELEADGVDVRAERVRLETVQRKLRSQQRDFLVEAGAAFQTEREAVQPDRAHWWWFMDEALAQQRQKQLRRTLTWALGLAFVCVVAWLVYDRFFAPPPEVQQAYQYSLAGENLIDDGDLRAALTEFEAAAAANPDDPAPRTWLGVIHFELDEMDEADAAFDVARSLYETEVDFLLNRCIIYQRVGDLEAASADVEQALVLDPTSGAAYYLRSGIAVGREDYEAAVADLEKSAELAQAAGDSQLEATARMQRAMVMQLWTSQIDVPTPSPEE